jgi:chromosome partitioning protein
MIITIAHQKGGVGKSTIAANLAVNLYKLYGKDLKVIDLDTQLSLSYFNSIRKQNGLESLPIIKIQKESELEKILEDDKGITLIDAGGFDAKINRLSMLYADIIITPVSDSPFELGGLLKFQEILKELRKARVNLKATVILNKVHPFASASLEEIFDFARENDEFDIFDTIIRDRGDFKKSIEAGMSVDEFSKESKASEEINKLIGEIDGKVQ